MVNTQEVTVTPITRKRGKPRKKTTSTSATNSSVLVVMHNGSGSEDIGEDEVMITWNVGKLVGMQSNNDKAVVSALRRSTR